MSYRLARQVLSSTLNDYAIAKPIDVAWMNTSFTPAVDTEYLGEMFIGAEPDERFLLSGDRIKGTYQVMIVVPINIGSSLLETLQTEIIDLYKFKTLNNSTIGYIVSIDNVYAVPQTDPNKKAVIIEWQAWRD
jgi:hypothetical protein